MTSCFAKFGANTSNDIQSNDPFAFMRTPKDPNINLSFIYIFIIYQNAIVFNLLGLNHLQTMVPSHSTVGSTTSDKDNLGLSILSMGGEGLSKGAHTAGGTGKGGTGDKGGSLSGEEGSGGGESHDGGERGGGRNCELHWKRRRGCQADIRLGAKKMRVC